MTGFARSQGSIDGPLGGVWTWEVRSVNGRGLDVRVRLPQGCESLDGPARAAAGRVLTRGSVTMALSLDTARDSAVPTINRDLLDSLAGVADEVARHFPTLAPARVDGLMALRGVLEVGEQKPVGPEAEALRAERDAALLQGLDVALSALVAARAEEGARLDPVLRENLARIAGLRDRAAALASAQPEALRERLRGQVQALLEAWPAPPGAAFEERLVQEAAILATKADVREELDRLAAHGQAALDLLAAEGAVGRRLDFLCQEFNREANTLCSKASEAEMTAIGLELKATIDQFREQVQNIE
ncbi:YicC/YloC family endoribonuclease [uncultured Rhodospira sp.]|uniref:YicC/YloC family endoribonuclease n=1 Tax=uncultured Rhodospira sp. TaxID=1936189 RepID=UPI002615D73C|nr:YicC/YloC family endoribonuclease [uncultured Rhodospira sp.]